MPPTQEMIERAMNCMTELKVIEFSAEPDSLDPRNPTTTVRWKVDVSGGCHGLSLYLNHRKVSAVGSQSFTQFGPASYTLSANMFTVKKTLRRVNVPFDTSGCVWINLPESEIRTQITSELEAFVAADRRIALRSSPAVEVTERGIEVSIRLKFVLDNLPDPKVNLDMVFALSAHAGRPVVSIRSFKIDIDFPLWVTLSTLGASKIAEEIAEDVVESKLKPKLKDRIQNKLDDAVAGFPGFTLLSIITRTDEIALQVCSTA